MTNAIIMAGGFGSRLRPLTDSLPKPMLSVRGRPVLDYSVAQLIHFGISDIVFSLGFMPESVVEWAAGYPQITPHFVVEDTPLGTLGGVKAAAGLLSNNFVVLSGDGINNIDLNAMLNRHLATCADATIAIKRVENPALYGLVEKGGNGLISGFVEKPHGVKEPAFVNLGTYVISKSALTAIKTEDGQKCDFARDLFPILAESGRLAYYEHHGYWRDIGDYASFYQANFDDSLPFFHVPQNDFDHGYRCARTKNGSLIADSAILGGLAFDSVIGRDARIESGSVLHRCVVADGATASGRFSDCIITNDSAPISITDNTNNTNSPIFDQENRWTKL